VVDEVENALHKIQKAHRIVIKVGSAVLSRPGGVEFDPVVAISLAQQIAEIMASQREVVLVSSGAILAGRQMLGLSRPNKSIGDKQALAAVGQVELMRRWTEIFRWYKIPVGQILLTKDDLVNHRRFLNARQTIRRLLQWGILPVINENDTVLTDEIKLGDNDRLSALVTNLITADALVLLTEVDGLYTSDPHTDESAKRIEHVPSVTPEIQEQAGRPGAHGTGGMATKVEASRQSGYYGVPAMIANGRLPGVLLRILSGENVGTVFSPATDRLDSRKHWIAFTQEPAGRLILDQGASRAVLEGGNNLFPSGIHAAEGRFEVGDAVDLCSQEGRFLGRGITSYGLEEVEKIKGHRSSEIEALLGYKSSDAVVEWEDMVVGEEKWGSTK